MKKYSNILLILVISISVIFILLAYILDLRYQSNTISWSIILFTLGSSLLSTAIYSLLYESNIDEAKDKRQNELSLKLTPQYSFPASDSPLKEYNELYKSALSTTKKIYYRGDKVLFLAFRLSQQNIELRKSLLEVDILLPNPLNDNLFYSRAQSLADRKIYGTKKIEEIQNLIKIDLLSSILAFGDLRDKINFSINFHEEIPFLRYEILDSMLVLSVLTMQHEGYYPPTLIYQENSLFYPAFLTNFLQVRDQSSKEMKITNSNFSESDILSLGREISETITIDILRKRFKQYISKIK